MFISKETLLSKLDCIAQDAMISVAAVKRMIDDTPTVDAVQVVRCEFCKNYNGGFECIKEGYGIEYPPDYFCGDGERKGL